MAESLAALGYNPIRFVQEGQRLTGLDAHVPVTFYIVFAGLIAVLRAMFAEGWLAALIVVNAFSQALAGTVALLMVHRAGGKLAGTACAFAFLIVLFDYNQWLAYPQSDPLFMAEAVCAVCLALFAATEARGRAVLWLSIAAAAATGLAVLTRPAWPPLLATVLLVALLAPLFHRLRPGPWVHAIAGIGAGIVVAVGLAVVCAAIYVEPSLVPAGALRDIVEWYRPDFVNGVVVLERPETYVRAEATLVGVLRVMAARVVYFFGFSADAFSAQHAIFNWLTHVPLYALAAVGGVAALVSDRLSRFGRAAALVAIAWILLTDLYHAVTHLDYGWRYRTPVYPALIFLAALGADAVIARRSSLTPRADTMREAD